MSDCERFQAEMADVQDLRPELRSDLERHAETCPGCRAMLSEYRALMTALRSMEAPLHIDGASLTRYAIQRAAPGEPDYDQARSSAAEIQQIEGHVSECPRCRLAVDSILEQYVEMDRFLAEAGIPPLTFDRPSKRVSARGLLERAWVRARNALIPLPTYATTGVALGAILVAAWWGPWLRDPYDRLAHVEASETSFLTRDVGSALTRGISLMNEGRYSEAITLLEQSADGSSGEPMTSYAHYLSGLAWVCEAKTELFGRVLAYNEARLDRAIDHLETVTESSASGRIREDAYWLLGKAYLMKREAGRAVRAFREVEQIDGRRAGEARQLIQAIGNLTPS